MKKFLILFFFVFFSCVENSPTNVSSPNNDIDVQFHLDEKGKPFYQVVFNNQTIIKESSLGFDFKKTKSFSDDFKIISSSTKEFNETWQMPWGEQEDVTNHYNELKIELQEKSDLQRKLNIVFKVYNDGVGFSGLLDFLVFL